MELFDVQKNKPEKKEVKIGDYILKTEDDFGYFGTLLTEVLSKESTKI